MNLKQVVVNNSGMSQDLSISKQDNKFAFENRNIRVQSTNDGTLLSVTNLRNPLETATNNIKCETVYGSCVTPDYLVIFCSYTKESDDKKYDCIYRVDLNTVDTSNSCHILYEEEKEHGTLGFTDTSYFDTLYYEEGAKVKKVYWTDNEHSPRCINLITPSERDGGEFSQYTSNDFEFYPNIGSIPQINVLKNRTIASELPAGVVQYFVSYYKVNGAETLIANASDLYTIDYSNRGAKADEVGMCAFDILIPADSVNTAFDYIRVYSVIRTTYDGPLSVHIVGDIKIDPALSTGNYTITDNGILQEQLQDSYIYFIGGTPFIAKTLTEKDGTLFFGGIATKNVLIPDTLKETIHEECFNNVTQFVKNSVLAFTLSKNIPNDTNIFGGKYPYKLQLDNGAKTYKTFKSGETYRFGIQFQTKEGQWTEVVWIGDAECTSRPEYDSDNSCFKVNDAFFNLPINVKEGAIAAGYENYRILMADPESSNGRKIKAQGVLCPTMFTPGQRAMNAPYSLPSWIMRPKNGKVAYHHFEPIFSSVVDGSEIASFTPTKVSTDPNDNTKHNILYPAPYIASVDDSNHEGKSCYIVTYVAVSVQNKLLVRTVKVWCDKDDVLNNFYDANGNEPTDFEILCDYEADYGGIYNQFYDTLRAKKIGWHVPYGYYDYDASARKYKYIQGNSENQLPIGLIEALESNNLPIELAPTPTLLGSVASLLARSGSCITNAFLGRYYSQYQGQTYYIGQHFGTNLGTGDSLLDTILKAGFIPIYGKNGLIANSTTVRSLVPAPSHSGSSYGHNATFSRLKDYEDIVFSTVKSTYNASIQTSSQSYIYSMDFCTLPEIFRPRCTVDGPYGTQTEIGSGYCADTGWGTNNTPTDANLYTHDSYNLELENITDNIGTVKNPYYGLRWYAGYSWLYLEAFIQIVPLIETEKYKAIKDTYDDYYVDESIVTLNSPDVDSVSKDITDIKLNIVGLAPLNNCTSNFDSTVKTFASSVLGDINKDIIVEHNASEFSPIYSDFMYIDSQWQHTDEDASNHTLITPTDWKLQPNLTTKYKSYLFAANNFLGVTSNSELENFEREFSETPGIIEKQQLFNQYFSRSSIYFNKGCDYGSVYCKKIDESNESTTFITNKGAKVYRLIYDNLIVSENTSHVFDEITKLTNKLDLGNTRVKFSTTPHVILNLQDFNHASHKYILPHLSSDIDYFRTIYDGKPYVWSENVSGRDINILLPNVDRGEWLQNYAQETLSNITEITSIWDENNEDSYLYTSEDYFINVDFIREEVESEESEICYQLNNRLRSRYNNPNSSFRQMLERCYTYDSTNWVYTHNPGFPKIIVGVYIGSEWNESGSTVPIDVSFTLNTKKYYLESFTYHDGSFYTYEEGLIEYSETYVNGTNDTDNGIIDYSKIYNSDTNRLPSTRFFFKWYKDTHFNITFEDATEFNNYKLYWPDWINFVAIPSLEFPITYESKEIQEVDANLSITSPYLFIGELYNDIPNEALYGGTDNTALRKLTWIPVSNITPITNNVDTMEGDTYYQRWDCLKTYPTTEEDTNQVVDITSFMVETHKNLDARTDINRATYNLMSRPSNFNLFNDVYNQKNNIFEYAIRGSSLASENNPNQIVWSMSKNYLGDVDTWTNASISSSTRVKYPVTKLVNYNNTVIALTEHSLEVVNFNAKQLVPSTDNTFIELQNSTKVDGTTKLQAPYGSYNMSTLITEKGLYFIEDNELSIIRMGGEAGITKIGFTALSDWLKNNITKGTYTAAFKKPFRFEYDSVHKDIYLMNEDVCIIYNESLEAFTSFIDYSGEYWLYNYNGKLYTYRLNDSIMKLYEMYAGEGFNRDFPGTNTSDLMEYSVWYRINPNAYSDKVFTNGTLMADCGVTGIDSLTALPNSTKETQFFPSYTEEPRPYINTDIPFDTIRAWTEYQDTKDVALFNVLDTPSTLKQKFRYWRFNIPRHDDSESGGFKRDRIRNPWMHLKLKGHSDKKMEFHNLTIQYME